MKNIFCCLTLLAGLFSCQAQEHQASTDQTATTQLKNLNDSSIIALPEDYQFPDQKHFSLLSWNVEHFVDPYDNPYINNKREDNPSEELDEKRALFVAALRKADADLVLLQEFESEAYLMQLAKDSLPELGYEFFASAESPTWYMNVVVMSRFPLGPLHAYGDVHTPVLKHLNKDGSRERQDHLNTRLLSVQFFPSAQAPYWLNGVHLKAGRGARNNGMRLGQIRFLQAAFAELQQTDPELKLIMAGDFNALPNSPELKQLTDPKAKVPLFDLLDINQLTHPAEQPERRLDYILINRAIKQESAEDAISLPTIFSPDSMRKISDHLPVMGKFKLK